MKQNYEKNIIESLFHQFFPVKDIVLYSLCETGIENSNFFIKTDSGEYVLKIFETIDESHLVQNEIDVMIGLGKKGIHIPQLFESVNGNTIIFGPSDKPTILMQYINGSKLYDTPPTSMMFFHLGAHIAELQNAFLQIGLGENFSDINFFNLVYIFEHTKLSSIVPEYADPFLLEEVWQDISQIGEDFLSLPRQIVHNDLNNSNIIYGDNKPYFIDFSDMTVSPCIADVSIFLTSFCFRIHWLPEGMRDFLRGYETIRQISLIEKKCLFACIEARMINVILTPYLDPKIGDFETLREYTLQNYNWLRRFHEFGKENFMKYIH